MKVELEEPEMIGDLGQSQPVELTVGSGNPNVNNNNNNNNQSNNKKNHHHHHLSHQQQQRHPDFPYYGPDPMSIPLNPHVSTKYSLFSFIIIVSFATFFTAGSHRYYLVCLFISKIKGLSRIINVNRNNDVIFGYF